MRIESHLHIAKARKGDMNCISARVVPNGKVFYCSALHLTRATFTVQPAGLKRFRESGQKNVHAFVRGEFGVVTTDRFPVALDHNWRPARYNPKENDTFIDLELGYAVHRADEALLIGSTVYYR